MLLLTKYAFLIFPVKTYNTGKRRHVLLSKFCGDHHRILHRKTRVTVCSAPTSMIESHPLKARYPRSRHRPPNLGPLHFVNLTNGIEALPQLQNLIEKEKVRVTRIQSSHCERAVYNKILAQIDNELLFALACGRDCYVYDFGSRNKQIGVPRALFLGLQFVKWSLAYLWFGTEAPAFVPSRVLVRGKNLVPFWQNEVMPYKIEKDTKQKIRYFSAYARELEVTSINLHAVYGRVSEIDGCKELHVKMIREWLESQDKNGELNPDIASWMTSNGFAIYDPNSTFEQLTKTRTWIDSLRKRGNNP